MSLSYVSYVERGQRTPSVKALRLLAERLGVSATYLETGIDGDVSAALVDAELELRLGQPEVAAESFANELLAAQVRGDAAAALRARIGSGLAQAALENHERAIDQLEELIARHDVSPHDRPDAYDCLARCYIHIGEPLQAVLLLRKCIDRVRASEPLDRPLIIRFSTLLSYAFSNLGDSAASHSVILDALELAEGLGDIYSEIRLQWSLGRASGLQGQPQRAAMHMTRAIALLEQTEDRAHLAAAHEVCATALLDAQRPTAAAAHLEVAERIFIELADETSLGLVAAEWARLEYQSGNREAARARAVAALDRLRGAGEGSPDSGPAWRTLAELHAELGDDDLAEVAYRAAVDALERGAPAKVVADAYRSYADFLAGNGRPNEALEAMRRATDLVGVVGRVALGRSARAARREIDSPAESATPAG